MRSVRAKVAGCSVALWAIIACSAAFAAESQEERARRELEAQLQQLIAPTPKAELELHYEGVDPGYRLERARFTLDDVQLRAVEGPEAHDLWGRVFQKAGLPTGEHVLSSQLVFKEHAPGLFDHGLSFVVKSTVTFRLEQGLRVRLSVRGVEVNRRSTDNRLKLVTQSNVDMLAEVNSQLPSAAAPRPRPVAEDAGTSPVLVAGKTDSAGAVAAGTPPASGTVPAVASGSAAEGGGSVLPASTSRRVRVDDEEDSLLSRLSDPRKRARLLLGAPESAEDEAEASGAASPEGDPGAPVRMASVAQAGIAGGDSAAPSLVSPDSTAATDKGIAAGLMRWGGIAAMALALILGGVFFVRRR